MNLKIRNNAPALCMLFGTLISLLVPALLFGWRFDLIQQEELHQIAGTVLRIEHTSTSRGGSKIHIYISNEQSIYHLIKDDLSAHNAGLKGIRVGDFVNADVKPDPVLDRFWLWGLKSAGRSLLTPQEVLEEKRRWAMNAQPLAYKALFVGTVLFVAGLLLRWRYGYWRNPI